MQVQEAVQPPSRLWEGTASAGWAGHSGQGTGEALIPAPAKLGQLPSECKLESLLDGDLVCFQPELCKSFFFFLKPDLEIAARPFLCTM